MYTFRSWSKSQFSDAPLQWLLCGDRDEHQTKKQKEQLKVEICSNREIQLVCATDRTLKEINVFALSCHWNVSRPRECKNIAAYKKKMSQLDAMAFRVTQK